ncbi:MAG: hypothetical protein HQM08_29820 [Candidatus Riflebacteria bacterium]|nr:hypothetical protein [Candidatus Riflebacteria bacterium]
MHSKLKTELPIDDFLKIIENHKYTILTPENKTLANANELKYYLEKPNSTAFVHFSFYGCLIWGSYQFHVSFEHLAKIKEIGSVKQAFR